MVLLLSCEGGGGPGTGREWGEAGSTGATPSQKQLNTASWLPADMGENSDWIGSGKIIMLGLVVLGGLADGDKVEGNDLSI